MNEACFSQKGGRCPRQERGRRRAFSLIELLAVVALMSVLLVMGAPLAGSLRKASDLNGAILHVSLMLEQAQAYARANNTYVWVGFRTDAGGQKLVMAAVAGTTGSADDLADGAWRSVFKPQSFAQVTLYDGLGLAGLEEADLAESSTIPPYRLSVGGISESFESVIRFGPMGDARINPAANSRWIQLGLRSSLRAESDPNAAVLQIAGLTGQVRIVRP